MMQNKVIYIVDDEKDIREMEKTFLENEGYRVETFANADSMMAKLEGSISGNIEEESGPDLIVMDIMMEGMDGLTACSRLRKSENPLHKVVPIILVSAKDTPLDRVTGLTMGSDDYLVKPFLPLELVARVKALLRRSELLGLQLGNATDGEDERLIGEWGKNKKDMSLENAMEINKKSRDLSTQASKGWNNPRIMDRKPEKCGNLVLDYAAHRVYVDLSLSEPRKTVDLRDENVDKKITVKRVATEYKDGNIFETDRNDLKDTGNEIMTSKQEDIIEVQVTPMEFSFVYFLMVRKETAVSKAELLSEVWHLKDAGLQEDVRMTDDLVKRLRKKLTGARSTARVETVWGFGYRLTEN